MAQAAARGTSGAASPKFECSKYNGWPEIKESLMTGRIQAAYMLAPLMPFGRSADEVVHDATILLAQ